LACGQAKRCQFSPENAFIALVISPLFNAQVSKHTMTLTARLSIAVLSVFLSIVMAPTSRADSAPPAVGKVVTIPVQPQAWQSRRAEFARIINGLGDKDAKTIEAFNRVLKITAMPSAFTAPTADFSLHDANSSLETRFQRLFCRRTEFLFAYRRTTGTTRPMRSTNASQKSSPCGSGCTRRR
jgi:hypothetical protein